MMLFLPGRNSIREYDEYETKNSKEYATDTKNFDPSECKKLFGGISLITE